jgi:sodium-coupled neutral amino acid transporter 11
VSPYRAAIPGVVRGNGVVQFLCSRRGVILLLSLFALFPLSLFRQLRILAKSSFIGLVSVVTIIICVLSVGPNLGEDPETGEYLTGDPGIPLSVINPLGIPSAISVLAFAYVCQQNVLLNFYNMKEPTVKRFRPVALASILITMVLLIAMGCAYITFRDASDANILNNFPMDNVVIRVCKVLFGNSLPLSY